MQSTICIIFIALAASKCRAKVKIIQGNDISIEFDKPLEITFTNDKTSDVEFRHQQSVVAYCHRTLGCNIDDGRFHITQNTSAGRNEYILKSNAAIQTDLCGVYECKDLLYTEKNSANVSIIGFDNKTCYATEEKDTIVLTTACIFNVSLSDMQIYWYTYDNTTLKLLDETRMGNLMTTFNNASVCAAECGTISAHNFTFGLNITDQGQGSTHVYIETKIFHPEYMNKPLIWRSSETFRVKDSSPKTPTHPPKTPTHPPKTPTHPPKTPTLPPKTPTHLSLLGLTVSASSLIVILIGFVIYAVIRFRRKRSTNTPTLGNTDPWIMRCMRRLLSRWGKAATPRHTETQPVGESDRDLQCIVGENTPFSLLNSCIHSQSDKDITLYEGKIVSIHNTEIESDGDLRYNSEKNKHHLPNSGIHSQSDEGISLCLEEIVFREDTEI